jgi:hypothetical protein
MLPSTTPGTASLVQEWPRKWGTVTGRDQEPFAATIGRMRVESRRDLHLPVETGGPPENRGLGRVRAGAVLEAFEHGAFRWPPISDGAARRAVAGQRSRTAHVRKSS